MLRHWLGHALVGVVLAGAVVAASESAAAADAGSSNAVSSNAVSSDTVSSNNASSNTVSPGAAAGVGAVHPFTGTGCHTYDFWSGAQVCVTVYGSGLHVTAVTGETDGPDSDWGKLWDSDGVVTVYGHPSNHNLTVDWSSGGGIWLPQNDDFCFTDTTLNQTACLLVHS
ncbi:MAG TPA: hypothetical protein VFU73_08965 [Actinocrinis sp.]|nr:hypothetical protein [Actinocrinis sp.]